MRGVDLFRKKSVAQVLEQAAAGHGDGQSVGLAKTLTARDLIALGISAIIGAGIFSTIGVASAAGGPAVVFLFLFIAVASMCTAFAYAEFAAMVPVAGSAYTYAYVAFGEIVAWLIGWALILEYAVGNVIVAVSWSDYFCALLDSLHVHVPEWARTDYATAHSGFIEASAALTSGRTLGELDEYARSSYRAWRDAPRVGALRVIVDVPAVLITMLVTWLVYVGTRETRNVNNVMVAIKLAVIVLVIVVGAFFIDPTHYTPFAPHGIAGVLQGVAAVFFAYVGFDAISTTAEECKNPRRDLPIGILAAIGISTVLYVLIAFVLTGVMRYDQLRVGDPLAYVFGALGMPWLSGVIAVSAVVAMTGVLLVFQLGQPRIWFTMSRDGLLPSRLARIHPRHHTPSYATVLTGLVVIAVTILMPSSAVLHLTSMGTLAAFVFVCAGVLRMRREPTSTDGFRTPYVDGRYLLPGLLVVIGLVTYRYAPQRLLELFQVADWSTAVSFMPRYVFLGVACVLAVVSFMKHLSLIPTLGLLFSLFMMAQIPFSSWVDFVRWLAVGLLVYFAFGVSHSRLALEKVRPPPRVSAS